MAFYGLSRLCIEYFCLECSVHQLLESIGVTSISLLGPRAFEAAMMKGVSVLCSGNLFDR